ncbi:polysaccharide lyase family 7 protein [Flavivirga aquimarina]|uniref:Polysaccharide lyase family 7 protein n=1 Tax=Flavivirga aquimarina TaxID=2027862 RepID=A0ABT8W685_9FLAO|nr:polysaccharide lyase family 7 protein [Flavivirga aquimarina]MDO5968624.1 polysaccharide lyase family 7 protein [Flavivirga aquimarina]
MRSFKIEHLLFLFLLSSLLTFSCSSSKDKGSDEVEEIIEEEEKTESKITWKNWYLSVPINNGDGKATSIFYQAIENDALTTEQSKYFYKNNDGTYTMFTKFTGFTTSGLSALNDKYCRTELREFWKGNQSTLDNWYMNNGTHVLETTLHVDFVEGNGRTIVAQIHGKETTGLIGAPATVKIRWNSGMIQIDYYTKPDSGEPWTSAFDDKIDVARVDNEVFTFKIKIENGKFYYALYCEAKNIDIDYTFVFDYVGNGYAHQNYFKTGNYFGWNGDYEKTAQVTLHAVKTDHL